MLECLTGRRRSVQLLLERCEHWSRKGASTLPDINEFSYFILERKPSCVSGGCLYGQKGRTARGIDGRKQAMRVSKLMAAPSLGGRLEPFSDVDVSISVPFDPLGRYL